MRTKHVVLFCGLFCAGACGVGLARAAEALEAPPAEIIIEFRAGPDCDAVPAVDSGDGSR